MHLRLQKHTTTPSFIGWDGILMTIFVYYPWTVILPISTSPVVGTICINHYASREYLFSIII
jgi:hypothetical protein